MEGKGGADVASNGIEEVVDVLRLIAISLFYTGNLSHIHKASSTLIINDTSKVCRVKQYEVSQFAMWWSICWW